ncbi:MAG: PQQ-binding-like beta-propeller repeat protein [bacterium]
MGDRQPLPFAEDSVVDQLKRRLVHARKGRLQWIHQDSKVHWGPVLRSVNSVLVVRRLSDSSFELVELSGTGRRLRRHPVQYLFSAPVLDPLGRIVLIGLNGLVQCLTPTFKPVWSSRVHQPHSSVAFFQNGQLLLGTREGKLLSLSTTGNVGWRYNLGRTAPGAIAMGVGGSFYLCTGSEGSLVKFSAAGKTLWKSTVGGCTARPLVTPMGSVVVSSAGGLSSFTKDGKIQWRLTLSGKGSAPVAGHRGSIYLTSTAGLLLSVGSRGRLRWSFPIGPSTEPMDPVIGPQGNVYVASPNGRLLVVSSAGQLLWHSPVPRPGPQLAVRFDGAVMAIARGDSVRLIAPPKTRRAVGASITPRSRP